MESRLRVHAEVRSVQANNIHQWPDWTPTTDAEEYQWFSVAIGPAGVLGADIFQVAVATYRGLRERRLKTKFIGLMVEHFVPDAIEHSIRVFVEAIDAMSWEEVVDELRTVMTWEFADYRP